MLLQNILNVILYNLFNIGIVYSSAGEMKNKLPRHIVCKCNTNKKRPTYLHHAVHHFVNLVSNLAAVLPNVSKLFQYAFTLTTLCFSWANVVGLITQAVIAIKESGFLYINVMMEP